MTPTYTNWTVFLCCRCGWATTGSYAEGTIPDTDCPRCKSHDVVRDLDISVAAPIEPRWIKAQRARERRP